MDGVFYFSIRLFDCQQTAYVFIILLRAKGNDRYYYNICLVLNLIRVYASGVCARHCGYEL